MSFYWNEYTWKEIEQSPPDVVLLPVGSVEAHGPHLPLATDAIISDEVARRSAAALQQEGIPALILPPLHYVITDFSTDFPGTISVSKEGFQRLLQDIADSLQKQGIGILCIVNSHLEPDHIQAIREFCSSYKKITVLFPDKTSKPWASLLTAEFKQGACHAGSYETSLVLASRKEMVRDARKNLKANPVNLAALMKQGVRSFKEAGAPEAYFGEPAAATVKEGEQTYQILTRMIVETVMQHIRAAS
jgi:creatinine amidohydrolase